MYRDIQIKSILTNHYLMGVVVFITTIYSGMLYLTMIAPYSPDHQVIVTVLQIPLQSCFFMVLWSMIRSIISDPGKVPIYWGVLMDDQESKKRRYCLICHIFKPERCHHCSTQVILDKRCQRCVLNMDHHCPWIGNCVGYQNRKFFILFLFYINVTVLVSFITLIFKVQPLIQIIIADYRILEQDLRIPLTLLLMIAILVFGVVIFNFFTFHIELVNTNKTTIDTLEMRRNNTPVMNNFYDVGWKENWLQVFGTRKRLWFFPMFGESGRPQGDGVHWERNQNIVTVTEQNLTHRTQTQQRVESQPAR